MERGNRREALQRAHILSGRISSWLEAFPLFAGIRKDTDQPVANWSSRYRGGLVHSEVEGRADLINSQSTDVRQHRHISKHKQRPAPTVCFALHYRDRAGALAGEYVKYH